jgi:hypothetical protein
MSKRSRRQRPDGFRQAVAAQVEPKRTSWIWQQKAVTIAILIVLTWAIPYFAPGIVKGVRAAGGEQFLKATPLTSDQFESRVHNEASLQKLVNLPLSQLMKQSENAPEASAPDGETTLVRMVLRGTTDDDVTIQRIETIVTERRPPARGIRVIADKGAGATPRYLRADLDTSRMSWSDEDGKSVSPVALRVNKSEEELVDLLVGSYGDPGSGEGCDCTWHINITYTVAGGEPQQLDVRAPSGASFRTSSLGRASEWYPGESCNDPPGEQPLCDIDPSTGN